MGPTTRRASWFRALTRTTGLVATLLMSASVSAQSAAPSVSPVTGATAPLNDVSPETLEKNHERFLNLLRTTGALGTFRREDGQIVVVIPESGSSGFDVKDAAALGIPVVVETRNIELADIALIKERVRSSDWVARPGLAQPLALFSARTGTVRIYSDAPADEFSALVRDFGNKVEYTGTGIAAATRMADYDSHWGGARMVSPDDPLYSQGNFCSSGWSVLNASGNPRMVTASHCFLLDWEVNSPQGSTFGEVKKRDDFPTNDFELVGGFGTQHGPSIYVGGATGTQVHVSGGGSAGFNIEYCFSGARSYENCDLEMDTDGNCVDLDYTGDGETTCVQIFEGPAGKGSCGGDSGAPFYRYDVDGRVTARGIIVARQVFPNDPNGTVCDAQATLAITERWAKIQSTYSVTIKTGG